MSPRSCLWVSSTILFFEEYQIRSQKRTKKRKILNALTIARGTTIPMMISNARLIVSSLYGWIKDKSLQKNPRWYGLPIKKKISTGAPTGNLKEHPRKLNN